MIHNRMVLNTSEARNCPGRLGETTDVNLNDIVQVTVDGSCVGGDGVDPRVGIDGQLPVAPPPFEGRGQ